MCHTHLIALEKQAHKRRGIFMTIRQCQRHVRHQPLWQGTEAERRNGFADEDVDVIKIKSFRTPHLMTSDQQSWGKRRKEKKVSFSFGSVPGSYSSRSTANFCLCDSLPRKYYLLFCFIKYASYIWLHIIFPKTIKYWSKLMSPIEVSSTNPNIFSKTQINL